MLKLLWVYAVAVVTIGAVIVVQNIWDLSKSDWASWVQAVGSMTAIVGAYFIGERQSAAALRSAKLTREAEAIARRKAAFSVLRAAHDRVLRIQSTLTEEFPPVRIHEVYHASVIDSLIATLDKLPLTEFDSGEAVDALLIFSGQFVFLRGALEKYITSPYNDPEFASEQAKLPHDGYGKEVADANFNSAYKARLHNVRVHMVRIQLEFGKLIHYFADNGVDSAIALRMDDAEA